MAEKKEETETQNGDAAGAFEMKDLENELKAGLGVV
jgi:hypothetical protein